MRLIRNLQSLRGAGAVMILAHHFGFNTTITKSFGDFAVSLFFVMSGFVLTLACRKSIREGKTLPYLPFMWHRVAKLYPLYLATMIIAWILPGHYGGTEAILPDILMIQSWFPVKTIYFSGNAIGWFVSDIMFCYLLFLPTLRFMISHRRLFHISAFFLTIIYFLIVALVPDDSINSIVYIFPPMQFPPFLIGMFIGCIDLDRHSVTNPLRANILILFSLFVTIVMMLIYPLVTKRLSLCSYWWIPSACLILTFTLTDRANSIITHLLHTPVLIKAGNLSYPFFLLHIPFIHIMRTMVARCGIRLSLGWEFLFATIIIFLLSYLVNRYFEKPIERILRSLLSHH